MENLNLCASALSGWSSSVYGNFPKKIQSLRNTPSSLMQQDSSGELDAEIRATRRDLNELLDDEELYWGQRAKAHWLKEGDKILNSFMLMLQIGENKTLFWGFGMNLGDGVRRRKV